MDLGRIQPGQDVTLSVSTTDGSGGPASPDAAPVATVTRPDSSTAAYKLAMDGGPTRWKLAVFLGVGFSLGTYQVTYSYSVAGSQRTASDTFEVIGGGDVAGRIISLYAYERPEAKYVVAHLSSGRIVQGRNPRI